MLAQLGACCVVVAVMLPVTKPRDAVALRVTHVNS